MDYGLWLNLPDISEFFETISGILIRRDILKVVLSGTQSISYFVVGLPIVYSTSVCSERFNNILNKRWLKKRDLANLGRRIDCTSQTISENLRTLDKLDLVGIAFDERFKEDGVFSLPPICRVMDEYYVFNTSNTVESRNNKMNNVKGDEDEEPMLRRCGNKPTRPFCRYRTNIERVANPLRTVLLSCFLGALISRYGFFISGTDFQLTREYVLWPMTLAFLLYLNVACETCNYVLTEPHPLSGDDSYETCRCNERAIRPIRAMILLSSISVYVTIIYCAVVMSVNSPTVGR